MSTKNHIVGTTAAEAEALSATAAILAAGGDPFGDEDEGDSTGAAADDGADDDAGDGNTAAAAVLPEGDEPASSENADDEGLSAEALAAIADDAPVVAAPRYKAGDPAEFEAQRKTLKAEKAKGLKDLMDGVIEPEAYSAIEAEVDDKLHALTVQRTLHEANVQTEQQTQDSALDAIMTAAKKAGEVDYAADPTAAKQFDMAMAMGAVDGDTRTYAERAAEAHKAVMAIRGVKPAAAALAANPRENGKGPMTLRNVPAADIPNTGGGWMEQLNALSGQEYEEAFSRLTPGQRAQLTND